MRPTPLAAVLLVAVLAAPVQAAITVPTAAGGVATITEIASVDAAKMVANLRWTDSLGTIRAARGVILRPQVAAAARLAKAVLGRRLLVPLMVADLLFSSVGGSLAPGVTDLASFTAAGYIVQADGTVSKTTTGSAGVTACVLTYIKAPLLVPTGTSVNSIGYLPCSYISPADSTLVIRVEMDSAWQPDLAWLNSSGGYARRDYPTGYTIAQGATVARQSGYYEYHRIQGTSKSTDVPTQSTAPVPDSTLASALMTPNTIGQLAQNDAIPADFFSPIDTTQIGVDPNSTTSGATVTDEGSTLPDGPSMPDVSTSAFNVMSYVPGLSVRWLPRTCPTWPPIKVDLPSLHLVGSYDWPNDKICAVAIGYISPVMQIAGICLFLGVVFRKFSGGE